MTIDVTRRAFVAGAIALGTIGRRALPTARRLRIGHTGITWGYAPPNAEQAIHDVASLGYHAFESFGSVLEAWEGRGGLGRVLEHAALPLRSAYCPFILTDPSARRAEVARATRWGTLIRKYGGTVAVIGPNEVPRPSWDFGAHRAGIVATLADLGRALADVGVTGALHQHTGSCIETRDETYAVMESVDTRVVKLAPDTGELHAGGVDPVQVARDFLPIIAHAHLKDRDGGPTHDGYAPLGSGRVDIAGVVDVLERSTQDLMLMVELNPASSGAVLTPRETAAVSRRHLESLGYTFRG